MNETVFFEERAYIKRKSLVDVYDTIDIPCWRVDTISIFNPEARNFTLVLLILRMQVCM